MQMPQRKNRNATRKVATVCAEALVLGQYSCCLEILSFESSALKKGHCVYQIYLSNLDGDAQCTLLCLVHIECFPEEYDIHNGSCISIALWVETVLKRRQEPRGRGDGSAVRAWNESELGTNSPQLQPLPLYSHRVLCHTISMASLCLLKY